MKSIKGPRSALSDFIQESNIKIGPRRSVDSEFPVHAVTHKTKQKRAKLAKPFELVNLETIKADQENKILEKVLEQIETVEITDQLLNKISMYLSRKRMMSKEFFDFLISKCRDSISIYDCSMIKNEDLIVTKGLKSLELFQCGQITENTLNCILSQMRNLENLKITGAFLLENFNVPQTLISLDVSNCSRLNDLFISSMEGSLPKLNELHLSFCYGFTKEAKLPISVEKLFICETKLTDQFYADIPSLKRLSIKRCPNVDTLSSIQNYQNLEYLDVEGIVTLTSLPASKSLIHLNVTDCGHIKTFDFPNLKYLNVSNIGVGQDQVDQILKMKNLKELDISWNPFIDDKTFTDIVTGLSLETIFVFGCFGLSKDSVDFAYKNKTALKVLGNPSETKYLLDES